MNRLIAATVALCVACLSGNFLQAAPIVDRDHEPAFLEYDKATGELLLSATGQDGFQSIELFSENELFLPNTLLAPSGTLRNSGTGLIGFASFPFPVAFIVPGETYNLGPVLPTGLGFAEVAADLSGRLATVSGVLGIEIAIARSIPEPTTAVLLSMAMLGLIRRRRNG